MDSSYLVYGTSEDRDYLLGVFCGVKPDIEAFLADKAGYGLRFEPLKIIEVPKGLGLDLTNAKNKIAQLKEDIKTLEASVKEKTIL